MNRSPVSDSRARRRSEYRRRSRTCCSGERGRRSTSPAHDDGPPSIPARSTVLQRRIVTSSKPDCIAWPKSAGARSTPRSVDERGPFRHPSNRASIWQARARTISDLIARTPTGRPLARSPTGRRTQRRPGPLCRPCATRSGPRSARMARSRPRRTATQRSAPSAPSRQEARPLFEHVRVDGLPPTTPHRSAHSSPGSRHEDRSPHSTGHGRTTSHPGGGHPARTSAVAHHRTGAAAPRPRPWERPSNRNKRVWTSSGLPRPEWTDLDAVARYARLVDAAAAADEAWAQATEPLRNSRRRSPPQPAGPTRHHASTTSGSPYATATTTSTRTHTAA